MWSNHPELTRNGLLPHAEKWFDEVRSGRTTSNSLVPTLLASFPLHHRGLVWSNHPELTQTYPVGMHPLHHSSSLRFGPVEPPRTHLKLHCSPASPLVRGGSVWSNNLKLTGTYPVDLLPPSSQRFGVVEPLRTHSKLPCKSSYPVVEGGSVLLNHPKLTRNSPIGLLPPGSQWFGEVRCGRTTPNTAL